MNAKSILIAGLFSTAFLAPMAPQPAEAQITKQGTGYLMRMKFVKGQVMKYTILTTSPMSKEPQKMTTSMTVKDVKNGIATVESVVNMPQSGASRNNKPMTQTMKIDNRGKVVGGATGIPGAAATATLPAGPVSVGQSWTGDQNIQGMDMKTSYTLLSVKSVGGRTVAEIAQKITGTMKSMGGKMAGQGRINLDARDGSMLSGTVNINITMPAQDPKSKPMNISVSTKITRN